MTSRQKEQLRADLNELRLCFVAGSVLIAIMGTAAIVVSNNILVYTLIPPILLAVIIFSVLGLAAGRALYWFLFSAGCFVMLSAIFSLALVPLLSLKNLLAILALYLSLVISSFFSWRWGAGIYSTDTMKEVLAANRIDLENGTYSPFTFPFGILKNRTSSKWFVLANTSGPLLITLAVVGAGALGRHTPNIAGLVGAICGYVSIVLSIGCIRAGLGEYAWIRKWEKETGRKMYISYVVDWKRYKEEEKRRKQAEQSKLRASRN